MVMMMGITKDSSPGEQIVLPCNRPAVCGTVLGDRPSEDGEERGGQAVGDDAGLPHGQPACLAGPGGRQPARPGQQSRAVAAGAAGRTGRDADGATGVLAQAEEAAADGKLSGASLESAAGDAAGGDGRERGEGEGGRDPVWGQVPGQLFKDPNP